MTAQDALAIGAKLLPDARKWVRRSTSTLDDEIKQTVAACMLDMKGAGIVNIDSEDPLIQQAAKLYLKAHFGYDDTPEKWEQAYERLKASLSLNSSYTRKKVEDHG